MKRMADLESQVAALRGLLDRALPWVSEGVDDVDRITGDGARKLEAEILAALAGEAPMPEDVRIKALDWQPIETAPKDRAILLWWPQQYHCPVVGHWGDKWSPWIGWKVTGWTHEKFQTEPTHWMPLPQSPQTATDGAIQHAGRNAAEDVRKLVEAARAHADPKNWKCRRCSKHDPINCYCGLYEGPLPGWSGEPYSDGDQPWMALAEALKPFAGGSNEKK